MDIGKNEVHLWCVSDADIIDPSLLVQYYSVLSSQEKNEYEALHFQERHQYLIVRSMLRIVLSFYIKHIPPNDWFFKKNKYGKPFIGNKGLPFPIEFNLSHTAGKVVLLISMNKEVGADVECIRDDDSFLDIAKNHFNELEYNNIASQPIDKQNNCFLCLWTLKEAYLKAIGKGLNAPLNDFYFLSKPNKIEFHSKNESNSGWSFWLLRQGCDHLISLAVRNDSKHSAGQRELKIFDLVPWVKKSEALYELIACND